MGCQRKLVSSGNSSASQSRAGLPTAGSRALKSLCCTADSKHRPAPFSVARCYINALLSSRLIIFNLD
jgi:hypothetical protein